MIGGIYSGALTIPDSVTYLSETYIVSGIWENAFRECKDLVSISIPKRITSIGNSAFSGCSNLVSINLPDSITSINDMVFNGCSKLTSIIIPKNVTSIGKYAFSGCLGLKTIIIPNTVKSIASYAFSSCSSIDSIFIPDKVNSIGNKIFIDCTSLKNIVVSNDNMFFSSKECVLYNKDQTKLIDCQSNLYKIFIVPEKVDTIGDYAFFGNNKLSTVTLSKNISVIGDRAFYACNLTSILLPNSIKKIGIEAFSSCPLTSISLPDSVYSIGDNAFSQCFYLKIINSQNPNPPFINGTISNSSPVIYVPINSLSIYEAASYWKEMNIVSEKNVTVDSVSAGKLMATINENGYGVFSSITDLTVSGNLNNGDIFQIRTNLVNLRSLDLSGTTLENDSIPDNAFMNMTSLYSITLPASIQKIGNYAFSGCTSLSGNIPISDSIKYIGNNAFEKCRSLVGTLNLSKNLKTINPYSFSDCIGLSGALQIPISVNSIGDYAFSGCSGLYGELILPQTVTSIGQYAFSSCHSFTGNLILPNSITEIKNGTFSDCRGLNGTLLIPNSVTTIGKSAFNQCIGFNGNLTIPNSVKSIGVSAFSGCEGFDGFLTLPNTIQTVNDYSFMGCSGFIGTLSIPNSVISIGKQVFSYLSNINNLTIGENCSSIDDYAFFGSVGIQNIFVASLNPPLIKTNTFEQDQYEKCKLIVPANAVLSYQTTNYWSRFVITPDSAKINSFMITVQLSGNGKVIENGSILKNGSIIETEANSEKKFSITPDPGFKIASLTLNGIDVISQLTNNNYTTPGIDKHSLLSVTFSKIEQYISTENRICEIESILEIPINASITPISPAILSYQFRLTYDASKLVYLNYTTDSTISRNGSLSINSTENGTLKIGYFGSDPLSGIGPLLKLNFRAKNIGETKPLITNFVFNTDTVNNVINGTVSIFTKYGDVDGNKYVQAYDAALTLQYSVGLDPLPIVDPLPWSDWRIAAADVDGVSDVSAYDAALILQYSIDLISSFPVNSMLRSAKSDDASILIVQDNKNIVFKSHGNVIGLNVIARENLDILGKPIFFDNYFSAVNFSDDRYVIGLATANAPQEGSTIMSIPLLKSSQKPICFEIIVNTNKMLVYADITTGGSNFERAMITIFPNPANDIIQIDHIEIGSVLSVFDLAGRKIIEKRACSTTESLSVDNLSSGLYYLVITRDGKKFVTKFIKK